MESTEVRRAVSADLPEIVAMLADDPLGATRETPDDLAPYRTAFDQIDADPQQHLLVVERRGSVIGVMQLTVIPGLSRTAMSRGLIEGVRTHRDARGLGLGTVLLKAAIAEAKRQGCGLVQLATDMNRADVHRFYENLGFERSHYGYKLALS